jgi:hypothetical protein
MHIQALNDSTSVSTQEVAVVAMGKLVSSLTMVTEEPYSKYPGLFEGLVKVGLSCRTLISYATHTYILTDWLTD